MLYTSISLNDSASDILLRKKEQDNSVDDDDIAVDESTTLTTSVETFMASAFDTDSNVDKKNELRFYSHRPYFHTDFSS